MIQADYFISQIVPGDIRVNVIKQTSNLSKEMFGVENFTICRGKAKDIDLHFVSSYDVIKVEPKCIEEYHDDKTITVYPNALEITVN